MNGPGTDSLEIRHTPRTVPGGARPGWGLPFERLPVATRRDLTPESVISEQIKTGKQQIQNKYALQWREANRSRRFIGAAKSQRMLREIDAKAKQEMLQFNQQAKQQMAQLQNINRLAEQGMITNPDEIKARVVFGADVAKSMYPTPARERTIPQQFGELDVYSHRISQELENFQVIGGKKPSKILASFGLLGIAASIYRAKKARQKLQVWDPNIPAKDPKTGKDVMGDWRKAESEDVGIYETWLQEEKDVAARKRELLGQPDITRRTAQPGAGSGFDAGVTGSITPQQQPRQQRVIRQRNRRTGKERISYDGGKSWQIVSG